MKFFFRRMSLEPHSSTTLNANAAVPRQPVLFGRVHPQASAPAGSVRPFYSPSKSLTPGSFSPGVCGGARVGRLGFVLPPPQDGGRLLDSSSPLSRPGSSSSQAEIDRETVYCLPSKRYEVEGLSLTLPAHFGPPRKLASRVVYVCTC